jgi:myo-inositol-1(or 4)-monophosphatase
MEELDFLRGRITQIILDAGKLGLKYYKPYTKGKGIYMYKEIDKTFITEADQAIEVFIRENITKAINDVGGKLIVFGEECGWTENNRESGKYHLVIDSIEGTQYFVFGIPLWGISVSLFYESNLVISLFYQPVLKKLFSAKLGCGLTINNVKTEIEYDPITEAAYLAVSSDCNKWDLSTFPGKIRGYGITGFNVACVVSKSVNAAFLTRYHYYDLAALALIAKESGASIVKYPSGNQLDLSELLDVYHSEPILICHPDQVGEYINYGFHKI